MDFFNSFLACKSKKNEAEYLQNEGKLMNKSMIQKFFLVLVFWAVCVNPCQAGRVYVVDGDSLEVGQERIRLYGIDAPEFVQRCYDENEWPYHCGIEAKNQLQTLVSRGRLSCKNFGRDKYGRSLKECFEEDGSSINRQMVLSGWAVDYGGVYTQEENMARMAKKGIWKGRFMRPELYRTLRNRLEKEEEIGPELYRALRNKLEKNKKR